MRKPFSLLLKPAGGDCNMRCDYCFYLDRRGMYPGRRRMSAAVLRQTMERYFATPQPVYSFLWQGGEPTLMGPEFFATAVRFQKELAPRGARIANSLQTNATAIGPRLASLLARYRFLVGCSIDGPARMHDAKRRTRSGRGGHSLAVRGLCTLQHSGVAANTVTVVSAANVDAPAEVYGHLRELGVRHLQFLPPLGGGVSARQWGRFLCAVFDAWYEEGDFSVSVRNFDAILHSMLGGEGGECRLAGRCDSYLVVEHNGDIYPCDFHVRPQWRLGNVCDAGFQEILTSARHACFAEAKLQAPQECARCEARVVCAGDCPAYRGGQADCPNRSVLCDGWKLFYCSTRSRFRHLVRLAGGHAV